MAKRWLTAPNVPSNWMGSPAFPRLPTPAVSIATAGAAWAGGPGTPPGPFGPIEVPLEEFLKLTRIPMQMVWGDNTDKSDRYRPTVEESRRFVELVNAHGGKAELLMLPDEGLRGNTHIPFADLNNVSVADLLSQFLHEHGLDAAAHAP